VGLFLLSAQLFALPSGVWIKANHENDNIHIKILLNSPMLGKEEAERRKIKPNVITHVTAQVNKKTVFEVLTSEFTSRGPFLQFALKNNPNNKIIKFITVDDNKNIKTQSFNINNLYVKKIEKDLLPLKEKVTLNKIENSKVWDAKTVNEAIGALYNSTNTIKSEFFKLNTKPYENRLHVPLNIKSELDLESIMVLVEGNTRATVAIFKIPIGAIIDYKIGLEMTNYKVQNYIVVIGKDRNGKLYKDRKKVNLIIPCINAGGGE
jgi:hypothetical protein